MAPLLRRDFDVGSELKFYDIQTLAFLGSAKVVSFEETRAPSALKRAQALPGVLQRKGQRIVRMATESVVTVQLDRELELTENALVECEDWCGAGMEVRNCVVDNLRGRAYLMSTVDGVIENCEATWISGPAVEFSGEIPWMQGPFSKRISIENNVFEDIGLSVSSQASYKTALAKLCQAHQRNRKPGPVIS